MPDNKKKICLNMIVKDEGHIIKETLESIYKYIDYYVINDTGSTDNTKEVIKEFFDEKGIEGEIVTHEFRTCKCHTGEWKKYSFFHFGWNRTYALQLCQGKSDYIFIMDADDLIVGDLKFPELTADCYMLKIGKGFTYQRALIFKNEPEFKWHYVGALHEYPTSVKPNFSKVVLEGDYYMDSRRKGARSSDPKKYLKDAKIFEELIKEEPENERYAFYCGQSYFDYKDYSNAIKWYRKRIEMRGWFEEVFYSYFRIAQAKELLGEAWPDIEKAYLDAYNYCKERSEPIYHIAKHYRLSKDFEKGYSWAKKGSKIPFPKNCSLFIYKDVYDYRIWDELALDAFYIGKFKEGYSIFKRLLEDNVVPENEMKRISDNLKMCYDKIEKKNRNICCVYTGNTVISQISPLTKLLDHMSDIYTVIIVGNKVDNQIINQNTIHMTPEFYKTLDKIKVEYLVLYDNLNYFYDHVNIKAKYTLLVQIESKFKLSSDCGVEIFIGNAHYLNEIFNKLNICKIVCINDDVKNTIVRDYALSEEIIDSLQFKEGKCETNILFDDTTANFHFNRTLENETNGLIFKSPPFIKNLMENKDVYDFAKPQVLTIYNSLVKQYPNILETKLNLALMYFYFNEFTSALINLEMITEKNKSYNSVTDIALMTKAQILHKMDKYQESYLLANEVLKRSNLPESKRMLYEDTRDFNVDFIKDHSLVYPSNKISKLTKSLENMVSNGKKVMVTITTCKRFDLFEKTINSFINCCQDLNKITSWLCVDDNSSPEDRHKMKKFYPFFKYIFKDESQKGHYISMNIIREEAINNGVDYILHMEDDWHYVNKTNYVTDALKILDEDQKIGQVLFNRNYSEVEFSKRKIPGGFVRHTEDGMRYIVHEYYHPDSKEYKQYQDRNKGFGTCGYWPHFSFRPSVVRVNMLKDVGSFYSTGHFEMAYAHEYIAHGYKSAFFDTFSCIHTGKKTWEKDGINSYHLNQTGQFSLNNNDFVSNYVLSSYKDIAMWKKFKESATGKLTSYTRHQSRNVKGLNDFEKHIFVGNEFNYLRSTLNKIVSSLDILRGCNSQYAVVLKETMLPNNSFVELMDHLKNKWENENQEYEFITLDQVDESSNDFITKANYKINLENANGYIISKTGIKRILSFVTGNRIKNLDYLKNFEGIESYTLNKWVVDPQEQTKEITSTESVDTYKELEGYKFYSNMDSFGEDIGFFGQRPPEELKKICDDKGGICFNTLGYIKHKVNPEKDFIYLPNSTKSSEGLYVKCS